MAHESDILVTLNTYTKNCLHASKNGLANPEGRRRWKGRVDQANDCSSVAGGCQENPVSTQLPLIRPY
jgi:hypothetical protein